MSKYHVWVNCINFHRIVVEASSKEEAESLAIHHFQCDVAGQGEADKTETRIATESDLEESEDYS